MPNATLLLRLSLAVALALTACDDDSPLAAAGEGELVPCLDRPGSLARAPERGLPCDLLPPDFKR